MLLKFGGFCTSTKSIFKVLGITALSWILLTFTSCINSDEIITSGLAINPISFYAGDTFEYQITINGEDIPNVGTNNSLVYLGEAYYQINDSTSKYLQRVKMPVITNELFQKDTAVIKLWLVEDNKLYEYGFEKIDGNFLLNDPYYTKIFTTPLLLADYYFTDNMHLNNDSYYHPNMYTKLQTIIHQEQEVRTLMLHHQFELDHYWNNKDYGELDIYLTSDTIVRIIGKIDNKRVSLELK